MALACRVIQGQCESARLPFARPNPAILPRRERQFVRTLTLLSTAYERNSLRGGRTSAVLPPKKFKKSFDHQKGGRSGQNLFNSEGRQGSIYGVLVWGRRPCTQDVHDLEA